MEMNDQVASGTEASPSAKTTRDVMARSAKFIFAIARAVMELARPLTSYRVTTAETLSSAKEGRRRRAQTIRFLVRLLAPCVSVSGRGLR